MEKTLKNNFIPYFLLIVSSHHVLSENYSPKIVGGFNVTSFTGYKHQVSIRDASHESSRFGSGHLCGGSLIDYDTVLTAAHCVHDGKRFLRPDLFVIVMGTLELYNRTPYTVVRNVVKVIGHKGYDVDTFKNDVAVLKLNSPVPLDHPVVQPIPLSGILAEQRVNESCQISGWGTLEYSEDKPVSSPWLVAANISINSKASCNRQNSHAGTVGKGMFCAGPFEGGKDSCQGDSGGPLTCRGSIVGITSHGLDCGLPKYPGIYMDVAYYREFIMTGVSSSTQLLSNIFILSILLFLTYF